MARDFSFPKPSSPIPHFLLFQLSKPGGLLFEYGLGVVGSPSRGIQSVPISVVGLDFSKKWQRVGWGKGFSCLFVLHSRDFRWPELVVLRKKGLWKGDLLRLSVWVDQWGNLFHYFFRFILVYDPYRLIDLGFYWFLILVLEDDWWEIILGSVREWTRDLDLHCFKVNDLKVLLSPRFVICVRLSCYFVWFRNIDVNSKGSVSFLKGCVDCLMLCCCEIAPPFARKTVGLVLWLSDWKGKIGFQEGEVLDDGTLPGLDTGYYPSFLPCLSDKSAVSLEENPSFFINLGFFGILYGWSAPNPWSDFEFKCQRAMLAVIIVKENIFTKLTYKMDGAEFFSLAKRWCSFYAHGLKDGVEFFSLAKRKIIEAISGVAATLDVVVSRSSVSPVLMFATLGL
ncbi:hypothetical protein V6N11_044895 [Hibiscus sabdariffa]|uniref:Uncharacterized protein n=1 Tax=Hibiscus sabdariffa TaxID=183260 RepID=A0ABR2PU98_9ROSI